MSQHEMNSLSFSDFQAALSLVEYFSGQYGHSAEADAWIRAIDELADAAGWGHKTSLKLARLRLRGAARLWLEAAELSDSMDDWPKFKGAFRTRFGERTDTLLTRLAQCKQERGERVQEYADRFLQLAHRAGRRRDDALEHQFIRGLRTFLRNQVVIQCLTDISEVIDYVKYLEDWENGNGYMFSKSRSNYPSSPNDNDNEQTCSSSNVVFDRSNDTRRTIGTEELASVGSYIYLEAAAVKGKSGTTVEGPYKLVGYNNSRTTAYIQDATEVTWAEDVCRIVPRQDSCFSEPRRAETAASIATAAAERERVLGLGKNKENADQANQQALEGKRWGARDAATNNEWNDRQTSSKDAGDWLSFKAPKSSSDRASSHGHTISESSNNSSSTGYSGSKYTATRSMNDLHSFIREESYHGEPQTTVQDARKKLRATGTGRTTRASTARNASNTAVINMPQETHGKNTHLDQPPHPPSLSDLLNAVHAQSTSCRRTIDHGNSTETQTEKSSEERQKRNYSAAITEMLQPLIQKGPESIDDTPELACNVKTVSSNGAAFTAVRSMFVGSGNAADVTTSSTAVETAAGSPKPMQVPAARTTTTEETGPSIHENVKGVQQQELVAISNQHDDNYLRFDILSGPEDGTTTALNEELSQSKYHCNQVEENDTTVIKSNPEVPESSPIDPNSYDFLASLTEASTPSLCWDQLSYGSDINTTLEPKQEAEPISITSLPLMNEKAETAIFPKDPGRAEITDFTWLAQHSLQALDSHKSAHYYSHTPSCEHKYATLLSRERANAEVMESREPESEYMIRPLHEEIYPWCKDIQKVYDKPTMPLALSMA